MDLATLVGLVLGLAFLIAAFILEGGKAVALLSYTAAMIVFGGTIGATVVSFTGSDLKKVPRLLRIAFTEQSYDPLPLIDLIVDFATQARRDSILSLEENLKGIDDRFLRQGLQLIIDRIETPVLSDILDNELYYMEERHQIGISIFETAGGYSPTMGIIGTVMGLIRVLGSMSTPEKLAPAIAMAFIATLYGVGAANLIWLPIAAKLRVRHEDEMIYRRLTVEGLLSIQEKENPGFIRDKLNGFLNRYISEQGSRER